MHLRARSPGLHGLEIPARLVPGGDSTHGFPMVRVQGGLQLSLEAAFQTYELIEASAEEWQILQQWEYLLGGVQ